MIIDVRVPAQDVNFDLSVDNDVKISAVIDELIELIREREKLRETDLFEAFSLYNQTKGIFLNKNMSLLECGVHDGDRLILT